MKINYNTINTKEIIKYWPFAFGVMLFIIICYKFPHVIPFLLASYPVVMFFYLKKYDRHRYSLIIDSVIFAIPVSVILLDGFIFDDFSFSGHILVRSIILVLFLVVLTALSVYLVCKDRFSFFEDVRSAIKAKQYVYLFITAEIFGMLLFFVLVSVISLFSFRGYFIRNSLSYYNYHHDGTKGKIYDGVGVTVQRLNGYGETFRRVDRVTICNKSSKPVDASVSDDAAYLISSDGKKYSGTESATGLGGLKLNPGMCVHTYLRFRTPISLEQYYIKFYVNGNWYHLPVH